MPDNINPSGAHKPASKKKEHTLKGKRTKQTKQKGKRGRKLIIAAFHCHAKENNNQTVQKINSRCRKMKESEYTKTVAKIQDDAFFFI